MSLGWLSQSSILPRKGRAIEGVSSSSLVELKATLFDSQSRATQKERSHAPASSSKMELKNRGVEERAQKDYIQFKRETDSYGALERKAQLYEQQLKEGELGQERGATSSSSLVDFERKAWQQEEDNNDYGHYSDRMKVDTEGVNARMKTFNPLYPLEREAVEEAWDSEEEEEEENDDVEHENINYDDPFYNREPEDEQERRKMEMARAVMNVARNTAHARARVQQHRKRKQRIIAQRLAKIRQRKKQNL